MAILALVFGILVAPLGLVFGFVARSQIKKTGEDGDGLALAGIIIGGIFTLLFIAYIVFIIIFFAAVASSVPLRYAGAGPRLPRRGRVVRRCARSPACAAARVALPVLRDLHVQVEEHRVPSSASICRRASVPT